MMVVMVIMMVMVVVGCIFIGLFVVGVEGSFFIGYGNCFGFVVGVGSGVGWCSDFCWSGGSWCNWCYWCSGFLCGYDVGSDGCSGYGCSFGYGFGW